MRATVIGAGLAGLTAATALAARGHEVTILEAAETVGGKARSRRAAGARIDLGPTLLLDTRPLRALAEVAGPALLATSDPRPAEPGLVAAWPDGSRITLGRDQARLREDLARLGAAGDWERFLRLGEAAGRLGEAYQTWGDRSTPRALLALCRGGGRRLGDAWRLGREGSLAALVGSTIASPQLRALLQHFARFLGLAPEEAPVVTLVIPYLLVTRGAHHPPGGLAGLAEALLRVAVGHGARLTLGTSVEGLVTAGRAGERVTGVRLADGPCQPADVVVAAVDAAVVAGWLPRSGLARRLRRRRPTLAARVAWWVVEGAPRVPEHHALLFEDSAEPLYVAQPTVTEPALAPPGTTIVHAVVHGPAGSMADAPFAESCRERLQKAGRWPMGPVRAQGVAGGDHPCYGYAIGPALFRSRHLSQRVPGLVNLRLAGGSVFPGPGVANAIRSGLAAARDLEAAPGGPR